MLLISNDGTSTSSGSDPLTTPSSSLPVLVIAAGTTGDTSPKTDLTDALTSTAGEAWPVAGLVRLKRASYVCRRVMPLLVRVIFPTSSHSPVASKPPASLRTTSVALADTEPVSPVMVMVDPGSRSQLALRATVTVLTTSASGVLCSMPLTSKRGTTTSRGSVPFATPSSSMCGLTMLVSGMDATCMPVPSSIRAPISIEGDF